MLSNEYIEHVPDEKYPKKVWETLERLTQKNATRLQYLENELARTTQELDKEKPVSNARLCRYLICG
ncbi:unnamed protein product [Citrullus colocynthis]|uniref:Uncharacterized protein n=1 Tax=Citrullus colocynthis TaxID=252529 RepID=A0ABP0Z248_9ROSI